MSTAIIIVTNEGGKEAATTIAASRKAAREVVGICKRMKGSKYVGAETMAALPLLAEAFQSIKTDWERERRGK